MSSSKRKEHVPHSVIKATRAVLLSSVKGVPIKNFCRDYTKLLGERFPWKQLGYSSWKGLLEAMPDIVRFEYSIKDGDYRLYGIGSEEMFMPSWVVRAQGNVKSAPPKHLLQTPPRQRLVRVVQTSKQTEHRELLYNARGLVTLFVSWDDATNKNFVKPMMENDIEDVKDIITKLVSTIAPPVEVYVHPNCYAFVRFSHLEDAQQVLKMVDGKNYRGIIFKATAANEKMPRGKVKAMVHPKESRENNYSPRRENLTVSPFSKNRVCNSSNSGPGYQGTLMSHDNHVTPYSERTYQDKSCDTHKTLYNKSCENGIRSYESQLSGRFRGLLDSESSDEEWDFDLLDSDLLDKSESMPILLNGARFAVPTVSMTTNEKQQVDDHKWDEMKPHPLSGIRKANENGLIPVRVSEVISPDEIWIQLSEDPEQDLEVISVMIFMSKPHQINRDDVSVGLSCCVLVDVQDENRTAESANKRGPKQVFRRARIVDFSQHFGQLKASLLLIDTGATIHHIPVQQLHTLPHSLHLDQVSPLSIPAAIDGIKSTFHYGEDWFPLDKQLLWEHLLHKVVYAKVIKKPSKAQMGVVDLYFDPTGTGQVSSLLLKKGLFIDTDKANLDPTSPILIHASPAEEDGRPHLTPPRTESKLVSLIKKSLERGDNVCNGNSFSDKSSSLTATTDSDFSEYYKEGPAIPDSVAMVMPSLECPSREVSVDEDCASIDSWDSLSDSRRLSYRNGDGPPMLTLDNSIPTTPCNGNGKFGIERTLDFQTPQNGPSISCKSSPWGHMKVSNGLV